MKKLVGTLACLSVLGALQSCSYEHKTPNMTFMPDMAYSPALKVGESEVMSLTPVEGTIPRDGWAPYKLKAYDAENLQAANKNPLPRTKEVLKLGQKKFNVYCIVCHGATGVGDGPITQKGMPRWDLTSDKVRGWADGQIFHIQTTGRGLMPSYASQVNVEERWAIVHYVRALQRAARPSEEDLKQAESW